MQVKQCVIIDMICQDLYQPDVTLIDISAPLQHHGVSEIETQLLKVVSQQELKYLPFPDLFELLFNRNMWIYNTGASEHTTKDPTGMTGCTSVTTNMLTTHGPYLTVQGKCGSLPCAKFDRF